MGLGWRQSGSREKTGLVGSEALAVAKKGISKPHLSSDPIFLSNRQLIPIPLLNRLLGHVTSYIEGPLPQVQETGYLWIAKKGEKHGKERLSPDVERSGFEFRWS